ncbi:hypothetical protein E1301_Tti019797 [Triplophysa tibetana]|uniref:Uncharacterized protein n=1 Tax=Triplophysa tibetana TaxID=1572043 RepID=A0A5A9NKQ6_9TELE|nr:hypothetical protein E1301_Tti019797 [Triplophysa tibetana]
MSLQRRTQTLDGMLSAVACVKESFSKKRNTESFQALYMKATRMCETLHLTPIASPRVRIPPQRFTAAASTTLAVDSMPQSGTSASTDESEYLPDLSGWSRLLSRYFIGTRERKTAAAPVKVGQSV